MIPDRHDSSKRSVEGVCIDILIRLSTIQGFFIPEMQLAKKEEVEPHLFLLAVLEVVQKHMKTFTLNTILFNDNTTASYDLPRVTLPVDLAKTSPRSQNFGVSDLDEVDLVFSTESFDELDVLCFCAGLDKNTEMCLTFIESFGTFAKTAS